MKNLRCTRHRGAFCTALLLSAALVRPAAAGAPNDVRAVFDRFVAAQNAHDLKAVEGLLLASPEFLWITRGTPIWGADAALKRFAALYKGTWHLDPAMTALKMVAIGDGAAQLYVPITFTIGPSGQPAQAMRYLMNLILVKSAAGWRVSSILPILAPAQ
jgi:ketosteroid isomerase-like protein